MDRLHLLNGLMHVMIVLLGAGIGSFLNVVIYRLPLGISVNNPRRSFCPCCKKQIPWYHNLPLITWLVLRGKCAMCGAPIAFRYFFVELLTAVLFYAAFVLKGGWWTDLNLWGPHVLALWIFLALLISGTFIDLDHFILPHRITMGGTVLGLLCSWWVPELVGQEDHRMGLLIAFLSAALGVGLLWSVVELGKLAFGRLKKSFEKPVTWTIAEPDEDSPPVLTLQTEDGPDAIPWEDIFGRESDRLLITCPELTVNDRQWTGVIAEVTMAQLKVKQDAKDAGEAIAWEGVKKLTGTATHLVIPREAMGMGDVFFIGMIGAFTGWKGVLCAIFLASIIGSVFAVIPRLFGKAEWTAKIPFGPYLAAGAAIWVFYGPQLLQWYLEWTGHGLGS